MLNRITLILLLSFTATAVFSQTPKGGSDPFTKTLGEARQYFDDNDWENAKIAYTEVNRLKYSDRIVDTLAIIENMIRYDAILLLATDQMKAAGEQFDLNAVSTATGKIAMCKKVISMYETAIESIQKALKYNHDAYVANSMLAYSEGEISKIKKKQNEYELSILNASYRQAKINAEELKKDKRYKAALTAYEEALQYLQNPLLRNSMGNAEGELEYVNAQIKIMRYQVEAK